MENYTTPTNHCQPHHEAPLSRSNISESAWDNCYESLVAYKQVFGDCLVPTSANHKRLGRWVARQRQAFKKRRLTDIKINRLNSIGFTWSQIDAVWAGQLRKLITYKNDHGHCKVPYKYPPDPDLGIWVGRQRSLHNRKRLSPSRTKLLEKAGFEWAPCDQSWHTMFEELKSYKATHGDCRVPQNWPENLPLANWVATQRKQYNKDILEPERVRKLSAIGYLWDPINTSWETRFAELQRYKKLYGDCIVPNTWGKNNKLAIWVARQRYSFKKGCLPTNKIARLNNLGFEWEVHSASWDANFKELLEFQKANGHCDIPMNWPQNPKLRVWIYVQKKRYAAGKLDPLRAKRLKSIGANK